MPNPDDLTDVRTGPLPTDPIATHAQLIALIEEAEAGGVAEGDVFARIRKRFGWKKP